MSSHLMTRVVLSFCCRTLPPHLKHTIHPLQYQTRRNIEIFGSKELVGLSFCQCALVMCRFIRENKLVKPILEVYLRTTYQSGLRVTETRAQYSQQWTCQPCPLPVYVRRHSSHLSIHFHQKHRSMSWPRMKLHLVHYLSA